MSERTSYFLPGIALIFIGFATGWFLQGARQGVKPKRLLPAPPTKTSRIDEGLRIAIDELVAFTDLGARYEAVERIPPGQMRAYLHGLRNRAGLRGLNSRDRELLSTILAVWHARDANEVLTWIMAHEDEASRIAVDIISKHFQENAGYGQFAILYRSNFQSRNYEKALRDQSIGYQVAGGNAFFDRREIKDVMAYLRLLVNPDDDQALLRIINLPRREIGATSIRQLADYANKRKRSLDVAMRELGLLQSLKQRTRVRIEEFSELIGELRHRAERDDALALCQALLAKIDYRAWLEETSTSPKQAEAAYENVLELTSWIGNLQKDRDDKSLQGIISHLSLMSILENNEEQNQQEAVQLSTIHASKGLEFDHVYLVGFEEDSLPHHQSKDDDGLEEERRLAYVGITRAAQSLTISYAKTRQRFGEMQHCEPSRFLLELPEDDLEGAEHVASKLSDSEKHQLGLDAFADLKAMLGTAD